MNFKLCVLFILASFPGFGQVLDLGKLQGECFIEHLEVFTDSNKLSSGKEILKYYSEGKFHRTQHFGDFAGIGKHNFWMVLDVKNSYNRPYEAIFEIPIARLDSFKVFSLSESGTLQFVASCLGIGADIAQKPLFSFGHAVKVSFLPNESKKLFFLVNKFPGSIRSSIIVNTVVGFSLKQKHLNTKLSIYLAVGLLTAFISFGISYYRKERTYFIFGLLCLLKILINLQIFNYWHLLQDLGFDRVSTSTYLVVALFFQYQFFKLYYQEKTPIWIFTMVLSTLLIDLNFGSYLQGIQTYYYFSYLLSLGLSIIFIRKIFLKIGQLSLYEIPFISVQLLTIVGLIIILVKFKISFANNFFRKYDFDLLLWLSILEIVVYLFYLIHGFVKLNEANLLKKIEVNKLQKDILEVQDVERRQIAADLHDDLGSTFALIKDRVYNESKNAETHQLIEKAIADLRSISRNLLPADFELFGFIPSLEKYIDNLNRSSGLLFSLIVFGDRRKLSNQIEINIYRVLIELLHNIKKHSKAKEATVQLVYHSTYLFVSVEEGESEQTEQESTISGIGQKTINTRLEYLKARILEKGKGAKGFSCMFEVDFAN